MWIKLAGAEDAGQLNHIKLKGLSIVFVLINGCPSAFDSTCPHKGGPLQDGEIKGNRIVCPWHRFEYDIFSGKPVVIPFPPKYGRWRETGDLNVYKTRLKNGGLYLELP